MWSPVTLFLLAQASIQLVRAQKDVDTCEGSATVFRPLTADPNASKFCLMKFPRAAFITTVTETDTIIITASAQASTTITIPEIATQIDTSYTTVTSMVDYGTPQRRGRQLVEREPKSLISTTPLGTTSSSTSSTSTESTTSSSTSTSSTSTSSTSTSSTSSSSQKSTSSSTTSSSTTKKSTTSSFVITTTRGSFTTKATSSSSSSSPTTSSTSKSTTSTSTTTSKSTSSSTTKSSTSSSTTSSKTTSSSSTTKATTTTSSSKTTTTATYDPKLFESFLKASFTLQSNGCKCITSRPTVSSTSTVTEPSTTTITSTSTEITTSTSTTTTVTTSTSVSTQQCPQATPNACNNKCINKQTDAKNCGSCGKSCGYRGDGVANICETGFCVSPQTCGRYSEYCGPTPSNKKCGCYKTTSSGPFACYKVGGNCSSKYCNTDADCGTDSVCLADCAGKGYAGQCTQKSQYDPCQIVAGSAVQARSPEDIFGLMGSM